MNERKKYILISTAALVVLLAITFVPMLFNKKENSNPPDSVITTEESEPGARPAPTTTTINGLSEQAENLPDNRVALIEENLFDTIKMSTPNVDANVTDTTIRDGTYKQTLSDPGKQIYFTTFIVDIPSLKQSYRVEDYYSPLPAQVSGLFDYATLILCLDKKDLIYGEFNCTDRIKQEQGKV
jgi:hypothetical protein